MGKHALALAAISLVLFFRNRDHILFTADLYHFFLSVVKQLERGPFLSQTANVLVYGNVDYGLNPRLMPAFSLARLVPDDLVVPAVYTGFALEMFIAVFIACWLLRLPTLVAAVSAWTACLAFLPYALPYLVWIELSAIIPGLYTASAVFVLFAAVFFHLGSAGPRASAISLAVLVALAVYTVVVLSQYAVLVFFMLAWACLGALLVASSWKERGLKIFAGVLVLAAFAALGLFRYLATYYAHNWMDLVFADPRSSSAVFIDKLRNMMPPLAEFDFYRAFHLARSEVPARLGKPFALFTLASAALLFALFLRRRDTSLYRFVAMFLVTIGGYLAWQWAYLEAVIAPLWAIMFSIGVVCIYRALGFWALRAGTRFPERVIDRAALAAVLGTLLLGVCLHVVRTPKWPAYSYGTTVPGAISETLERELGLRHSRVFRGRLANLAAVKPAPLPDGRLYIYEAQQILDHDIARTQGLRADFRRSMMSVDVPTLFDISRFTSPGTVAVMNFFLTDAAHYKQEQFLFPSRFDSRWMAAFGIRYVVHNAAPGSPAPAPVARQRLGQHELYLYEIPDPNVGNYSPTDITRADSLAKALDALAQPGFDFRKQAVAEDAFPGPLVAATQSSLELDEGSLVLRAASPGRSLIVLPFEFSRCLRVAALERRDATLPTLHRVNAHQIGVLFERAAAARISFAFGPFHGGSCRSEDVEYWRAFGAPGVKSFRGVDIRGGH